MAGSDFIDEFKTAAEELFETIENKVIILEKEKTKEDLNELFRAFHTLKGNSALIGLNQISDLSHAVEGMMGDVRNGLIPMSHTIGDLILSSVDILKRMIDEIEEPNGGGLDASPMISKIKQYRKEEKAGQPNPKSKPAQKMSIKTLKDLAILEFPEKFDKSYANDLLELLRILKLREIDKYVFNFAATKSVTFDEINAFISSRREIDTIGGSMASCGMSPELLDAFNNTGKGPAMNIKPKLKDAIEFLRNNQ